MSPKTSTGYARDKCFIETSTCELYAIKCTKRKQQQKIVIPSKTKQENISTLNIHIILPYRFSA